jgi:hypothetical protein
MRAEGTHECPIPTKDDAGGKKETGRERKEKEKKERRTVDATTANAPATVGE